MNKDYNNEIVALVEEAKIDFFSKGAKALATRLGVAVNNDVIVDLYNDMGTNGVVHVDAEEEESDPSFEPSADVSKEKRCCTYVFPSDHREKKYRDKRCGGIPKPGEVNCYRHKDTEAVGEFHPEMEGDVPAQLDLNETEASNKRERVDDSPNSSPKKQKTSGSLSPHFEFDTQVTEETVTLATEESARIAEESRAAAEKARVAEEYRVAEEARVAEEYRVAEVARVAEEARVAAEEEAKKKAARKAAKEKKKRAIQQKKDEAAARLKKAEEETAAILNSLDNEFSDSETDGDSDPPSPQINQYVIHSPLTLNNMEEHEMEAAATLKRIVCSPHDSVDDAMETEFDESSVHEDVFGGEDPTPTTHDW